MPKNYFLETYVYVIFVKKFRKSIANVLHSIAQDLEHDRRQHHSSWCQVETNKNNTNYFFLINL